jgi:hypothetical protein
MYEGRVEDCVESAFGDPRKMTKGRTAQLVVSSSCRLLTKLRRKGAGYDLGKPSITC